MRLKITYSALALGLILSGCVTVDRVAINLDTFECTRNGMPVGLDQVLAIPENSLTVFTVSNTNATVELSAKELKEGLGFLVIAAMAQAGVDRVMEKRRHVLYEVDHKSILAACRELEQKLAGELPKTIEADSPILPAIIRELEPCYVEVSTNGVRISLAMGFDHFGLFAYPSGKEPETNSMWTSVRGLIYMDEGFGISGEKEWTSRLLALNPNNELKATDKPAP